MDRTTLTAILKPLQRRGLVETTVDKADRRGRRLRLTQAGQEVLQAAVPIWRRTHAEVDRDLAATGAAPDTLRQGLRAIARGSSSPAHRLPCSSSRFPCRAGKGDRRAVARGKRV